MGRPRTYNIAKMVKEIEKYLENTNIPILKKICFEQKWNYNTVMKLRKQEGNEVLDEAIERLLYKKEFMLEELGLSGDIDRTMAIFSLKQLGWSDRDRDKIELERDRLELDRQKASGSVEVDVGAELGGEEGVIVIDDYTKNEDKKCHK